MSQSGDCGRAVLTETFPDGESALVLVAARLRHVAGTKWRERVYLDMTRLREAIHDETGT